MVAKLNILRIAIASPLRRSFDYLPPSNCDPLQLRKGLRVRIPFGHRETIGILLAWDVKPEIEVSKLKRAYEIIDAKPLISDVIFALCLFASDYYHHPLGEVLFNALPKLLRTGRSIEDMSPDKKNASNQINTEALTPETLELNAAQKNAVTAILENIDQPQVFLIDGATGSGKTEVYLRVIEKIIKIGKQALILVPEISLTPQTVTRFAERFPKQNIALLHSGLTDKMRYNSWRQAKDGSANIIIGTRSALFVPLLKPGLIVIDEEHDLSFKQQSGLRYSARDLAVVRSKLEKIPIILGSATPSFESIANTKNRRYIHLTLPERAGNSAHPNFHLVDIRKQRLKNGLSLTVIQNIEKHSAKGGQILIFVNRRGYAPTLICHHCGWVAQCAKCDVRLTLHQKPQSLCCHHCGAKIALLSQCPNCKSGELIACGIGTERLETGLKKLFPALNITRIDSDTTRKKGAMQKIFQDVTAGNCNILLGTQMLTKGHHFPDVSMVVILNADSGLYSADFRANEYLAQLIIQVAGRAGRAEKTGEVYIQTHNPDHPLLSKLINSGYNAFAQVSFIERNHANLPPFSHLALIRAESKKRTNAHEFLIALRDYGMRLNTAKVVQILGPAAAAIERKSDRFRAQLLLQSNGRTALHNLIFELVKYIEKLPLTKTCRWSIDIDPVEILS